MAGALNEKGVEKVERKTRLVQISALYSPVANQCFEDGMKVTTQIVEAITSQFHKEIQKTGERKQHRVYKYTMMCQSNTKKVIMFIIVLGHMFRFL